MCRPHVFVNWKIAQFPQKRFCFSLSPSLSPSRFSLDALSPSPRSVPHSIISLFNLSNHGACRLPHGWLFLESESLVPCICIRTAALAVLFRCACFRSSRCLLAHGPMESRLLTLIFFFVSRDAAVTACLCILTQARGPKKHMKRLAAPHHWMLSKMGGVYAPRPSQGPHKMRECVPLVVLLRNRLKYALTRREVMMIVMQRLVKIDGKVRTDSNFPAGLMGTQSGRYSLCLHVWCI